MHFLNAGSKANFNSGSSLNQDQNLYKYDLKKGQVNGHLLPVSVEGLCLNARATNYHSDPELLNCQFYLTRLSRIRRAHMGWCVGAILAFRHLLL